jgi:hypothetical protein
VRDEDIEIFLREYGEQVVWPWHLAKPPGRDTIEAYLRSLKKTAPGKDGIPNRAWQQGGTAVAEYLTALLDAHLCKAERPLDINDCLFHFIPKDANASLEAQTAEIVFRHPSELRPLTLKKRGQQNCSWLCELVADTSDCQSCLPSPKGLCQRPPAVAKCS